MPVISIRALSGKALQRDSVKRVGVSLLGQAHRIVNNTHKFEFIQTERVTERCLPRTISVYLSDGKEHVSNEVTLIFDSISDDINQRKKIAKLSLKNYRFDNKETYWLILIDSETQVEYQRISMTVDIAFQNLF